MGDLRVAIIGARPRTDELPASIGFWQAREFKKAGADIVAVVGSSPKSSYAAAAALESAFQIHTTPFSDLEAMLKTVKPDAVSVCSPTKYHYSHAKTALEAGADVLCEKPLHWDLQRPVAENRAAGLDLLTYAFDKKLLLSINTQLSALIPPFSRWYRSDRRLPDKAFYVNLITEGQGYDQEIVSDLLSHPLAMLLSSYPDIKNLQNIVMADGFKAWQINFNAEISTGIVPVTFAIGKQGKKQLLFGMNNHIVERITEPGDPPKYFLESQDTRERVPVEDPLSVSISKFCKAASYRKGYGYYHAAEHLLIHPMDAERNFKLLADFMNIIASSQNPPVGNSQK